MYATEASRARAGVTVDKVGAVGAILARVALALVDVLLAPRATETRQARADEAVDTVFAVATVAAWV